MELIIALALGVLISGAALTLFFESAKNKRAQEGIDNIQDAAVFSLNYLEKEIAMANLGTYRAMTASSPLTGLLFSPSIQLPEGQFIGSFSGFGHHADLIKVVSRDNAMASNIKESSSDQLTLQYIAPFDMVNCESATVMKGQYVVERIFTREESSTSSHELVLACDAGIYDLANIITEVTSPTQYAATAAQLLSQMTADKKGSVLINRVDYFTVKLGVMSHEGLQYLDIDEYCMGGCDDINEITTVTAQNPIVAIKLGVIVRSVNNTVINLNDKFSVLGEEVSLDTAKADNNYTRRVLEKTIRLKNSVLPVNMPTQSVQ